MRNKVSCGNSGNPYLYHRCCCHNVRKHNDDWLSPLQTVLEDFLEHGFQEAPPEEVTKQQLQKKIETAEREDRKFANATFKEGEYLDLDALEVMLIETKLTSHCQ